MPKSDQGTHLNRYVIIPRTLIFLFDDAHVLLLKGTKKKNLWAQKYNGIGGHIEPGEDALASAERELWEETGLSGIPLHLCGVVMCDVDDEMGVGLYVFKGWGSRSVELIQSDEGELEWVPLAELNTIPVVDDLPNLLPKVDAWQAGDAPFFARNYYETDEDQLNTRFHR